MMAQSIEPTAPAKTMPDSLPSLVAELQRENIRLQRLVSELLLRNQQLRAQQGTH